MENNIKNKVLIEDLKKLIVDLMEGESEAKAKGNSEMASGLMLSRSQL